MTTFKLTAVVSVVFFCMCAQAQQDAPPPQLKALQHYAGEWKMEARLNSDTILQGHGKSQFVLDGRFLEQNLNLHSMDGGTTLKLRFLRTWDVDRNEYRSWSFASSGDTQEWTGKWNEDSRSMTWTAKRTDGTMTLTSEFREDGTEEWMLVTLDEFGNQRGAVGGTTTRVQN